jgi:hypothetical protein
MNYDDQTIDSVYQRKLALVRSMKQHKKKIKVVDFCQATNIDVKIDKRFIGLGVSK